MDALFASFELVTKERLHFGDTKIYVIPSVSTIAYDCKKAFCAEMNWFAILAGLGLLDPTKRLQHVWCISPRDGALESDSARLCHSSRIHDWLHVFVNLCIVTRQHALSDQVLAGFEKCGSSSLSHNMAKHPEADVLRASLK